MRVVCFSPIPSQHRLPIHAMLWVGWVAAGLTACGGDPAKKPAPDVGDAGDAVVLDAAEDALAVDSGPPLSLKWTQLVPDATDKMRAAAPVPGKPGSYVVVGEKGMVLRLDGAEFTDISPTSVGKPDLNAVWVEHDGSVVVAGAGSTLITFDGTSWQVAGAVPPTPPVTFLAVDGAENGEVWAVGESGAAYKRSGAVWAAVTVTVTDGGGEAIGADAHFVDVRVTDKGTVWIAASEGATAPGVVVRSDDGKTWTGVATSAAPRALWVDPTDGSQAGGALVVGGTTSAFVARWNGTAFVDAGDVQWSLGFRSVTGVGPKNAWIGGLKGQVRHWDGTAWSVVKLAPPPGTVSGFPTPSADVLSLNAHSDSEFLVLTHFKLYRYGVQP